MSFEERMNEKLLIGERHVCQLGRTALLVIDMKRGFIDEGADLAVDRARAIVPRVAKLVETCRRRAVPVVFTQFVYDKFYGTPLDMALRGRDIRFLLVIGIVAEQAYYATWRNKYARLLTAREAIDELQAFPQ